jgi:hypothetical protein
MAIGYGCHSQGVVGFVCAQAGLSRLPGTPTASKQRADSNWTSCIIPRRTRDDILQPADYNTFILFVSLGWEKST